MSQNNLFFLRTISSENSRFEDVRRQSGKLGYWIAMIPFVIFWPFFLVHAIFSMRRHTAFVKSYDAANGD